MSFLTAKAGSILLIVLFLLSACGTGEPAPVVSYGLRGGATSAGVHTVSEGDKLWDVAQRYGVDMKDMIYVNHLSPPYALTSGDRLTLPPPATYVARPGDSLYAISRTFGVSVTQLAHQNNMRSPYRIRSGDTLRLPSVKPPDFVPPVQNRVAALAPVSRAPVDGPPVASRPVEVVQKSLPVKTQTPPRSGSTFAWPVDGSILSSFGPKKDGLHNDGINIRATRGTPVRAAENGVVVYADSRMAGFGNLVLVRHADRWMTAYAHLDKTAVRRGQEVKRGETVGTVGSSGGADSPQLHFEIRRGTEALNPEAYLARRGS